VPSITTDTLEIHYQTGGLATAPAVLLLHGWPDDVREWQFLTPSLERAGYRWIAPWLRGCGPTRFLSANTVRDGRTEAMTQDAVDLMDGLGIDACPVIGHDCGARIAYALGAIVPRRLISICALSLAYAPRGIFTVPAFRQSRAWWYQWFMSVDRGRDAIARDPKGFARLQWDTWSPGGWFDAAEFDSTARSFENPDWLAITFSSYRSRWRNDEPRDPRYANVATRIAAVEKLAVPTLMIQGAADATVLAASSEGKEQWFTDGYDRVVLDGVGHFPAREAPGPVARAILSHLRRY
jgi:pimeloyl-ACP methyl ester carboxylesterase